MKNETIPLWVPKCKICGNQMVDATALMMGSRFRCPQNHSIVLETDWDSQKKAFKHDYPVVQCHKML